MMKTYLIEEMVGTTREWRWEPVERIQAPSAEDTARQWKETWSQRGFRVRVADEETER
jgi:hypothetical protein